MTLNANLESEPLLNQDKSPLIQRHEHTESAWTTKLKQIRRVVIPPHHLLAWIHDSRPTEAIPMDAQFRALGMDAVNNWIGFEYTSLIAPEAKAFYLKITDLKIILKEILRDRVPTDIEISAIYLSGYFTYMMIEISSHRFPEVPIDTLPLIQVRYEGKELIISDQSKKTERFTKETV